MDPQVHTLLAVSASFAGYHAIKRLAGNISLGSDSLTEGQVLQFHRTFDGALSQKQGIQALRQLHFPLSLVHSVYRDSLDSLKQM